MSEQQQEQGAFEFYSIHSRGCGTGTQLRLLRTPQPQRL